MGNSRYSRAMGVFGLLILCISCIVGCQDDLGLASVVEGEPATISVQVDLSTMPQLSRSNEMNANLENRVNNLWVGVYNVATGQRTGYTFVDGINGDFPENTCGSVSLDAASGESYIVAVANCVNTEGTTLSWSGKDTDELKALLDAAETRNPRPAWAISWAMPTPAMPCPQPPPIPIPTT